MLVVRSQGAFTPSVDRIVVPRTSIAAILTSVHIKANHPTAHQLKLLFNRNFACLDIDSNISDVIDNCHKCATVKRLPKHITPFSTSDASTRIGQVFSIDVLRRAKQLILVSRETVTSYTCATFIKSEKAIDIVDGLISLVTPLHSHGGPESIVRSDSAPAFKSLFTTQPLVDKGIRFELDRTKKPNKSPIIDKAIRELEDEIVRIVPSGNPLSIPQLTFAVSNLNSRIRHHGISAFEAMFRRNQFTSEELNIYQYIPPIGSSSLPRILPELTVIHPV